MFVVYFWGKNSILFIYKKSTIQCRVHFSFIILLEKVTIDDEVLTINCFLVGS